MPEPLDAPALRRRLRTAYERRGQLLTAVLYHQDLLRGSVYDLVEDFVRAVGRGVMNLLILDRGFIDGEAIGRCKEKHRIDVLIPLTKTMDLFVDVMGLGSSPDAQWQELPAPPAPASATTAAPAPRIGAPGRFTVSEPQIPELRSCFSRILVVTSRLVAS